MSELAQYRGTGKRKTSIARVILRPGDGKSWINGRTHRGVLPARRAPQHGARAARGRRRRRARTTCGSASTAAGSPARPVRSGTASPARSSRPIRSSACRSSARASSRATRASSSARRPACTRPARLRSSASADPGYTPLVTRASQEAGSQGRMMARSPQTAQDVSVRRYFGTDGVRGVVGET